MFFVGHRAQLSHSIRDPEANCEEFVIPVSGLPGFPGGILGVEQP
jgi:hypothetical protein